MRRLIWFLAELLLTLTTMDEVSMSKPVTCVAALAITAAIWVSLTTEAPEVVTKQLLMTDPASKLVTPKAPKALPNSALNSGVSWPLISVTRR